MAGRDSRCGHDWIHPLCTERRGSANGCRAAAHFRGIAGPRILMASAGRAQARSARLRRHGPPLPAPARAVRARGGERLPGARSVAAPASRAEGEARRNSQSLRTLDCQRRRHTGPGRLARSAAHAEQQRLRAARETAHRLRHARARAVEPGDPGDDVEPEGVLLGHLRARAARSRDADRRRRLCQACDPRPANRAD